MQVIETKLGGVVQIIPTRHGDQRGYFSETFRSDWFWANVGPFAFVQENQSLSRAAGVVRGLHFQSEPSAQGKLVRCLAGSIFDVAVDIRAGSPTFGQWVGCNLSSDKGNQLFVPPGFLHGFCTLEPDCLVSYKVTAYYDPQCDKGVLWNDPAIGIDWPEMADPKLLSAKDTQQTLLADLPPNFTYQGA